MIIGITGTNGAGKGTVVEYLVKYKGFKHYSARDFIVKEIERRGMPVTRTVMQRVGNELRAAHGPAFIIQELYKRAIQNGGDAVIESIRTPGELSGFKRAEVVLWAVDADQRVRYERSVLRGSETDHVTFEQFAEQEEREMQSDDPTKQNIRSVIKLADAVFANNGAPHELYRQVEKALQEV